MGSLFKTANQMTPGILIAPMPAIQGYEERRSVIHGTLLCGAATLLSK